MPVKEKSDAKLTYSIDGKVFKKISEIPDLSTVVEEADCKDVDWFWHPQELSFTCDIPQWKLLNVFLDKETFIRYCQSTKSNNWLKRHGLPMCRKIR